MAPHVTSPIRWKKRHSLVFWVFLEDIRVIIFYVYAQIFWIIDNFFFVLYRFQNIDDFKMQGFWNDDDFS